MLIEHTFSMTVSTLWCITRSALWSRGVVCKLTTVIRPRDFFVNIGRPAQGKICREVPTQIHRSACL